MITKIRNHAFVISDDNKVLYGISDKGWHEEIFMVDDEGNLVFMGGRMSVSKFRKMYDAGMIVLK